ncbi:MAG: hypothetical protein HY720_32195 [Planctomycetes bacterium]|nr:hypothetical protein [Planctomycetota bacterium]
MALPDPRTNSEDFADELVYFSARVAANPKTAHLAATLDEEIEAVDGAHETNRDRRRDEIRSRARRDFIDSEGDDEIASFRKELGGYAPHDHDVVRKTFPDGVRAVVAPTGVEQLKRLKDLVERIELALRSPALAAEPAKKKEKIEAVLTAGKETAQGYAKRLGPAVEVWKAALTEHGVAKDSDQATRQLAYARAGGVLGLLREALGGSRAAADAYTHAGPTRRSGGDAEEGDLEAGSGPDSPSAAGSPPEEPAR